ncbi:hypothetical protein EYZ11_005405 [Aspergillus tanneri]|uniref:Uncharacterized protein n=1 Tax=Aspergillus tanneri TaxID=1220188 RepID=A0A4S3JP07_9EURO|nr:uncharacterized protein ATNIH1004_006696 [Aspergillus tanneri]KAA8645277.1 hypothetical protein ATNIH1004_006696 [Aspergillus tanneri]THC95121.1 hypothetical protein EYZ11_005405 [Aspergillus tanneri]
MAIVQIVAMMQFLSSNDFTKYKVTLAKWRLMSNIQTNSAPNGSSMNSKDPFLQKLICAWCHLTTLGTRKTRGDDVETRLETNHVKDKTHFDDLEKAAILKWTNNTVSCNIEKGDVPSAASTRSGHPQAPDPCSPL